MVSKSSSWVKNILIVISWNGENIHATLICVWGGKTLYMTLYLTFAIFVKKNTCSRIKVFVLFTPLSSSIPSLLLGESLLAKKFTGTLCQAGLYFKGLEYCHQPPGMEPGVLQETWPQWAKGSQQLQPKRVEQGPWGEERGAGKDGTPFKADCVWTTMQPQESRKTS